MIGRTVLRHYKPAVQLSSQFCRNNNEQLFRPLCMLQLKRATKQAPNLHQTHSYFTSKFKHAERKNAELRSSRLAQEVPEEMMEEGYNQEGEANYEGEGEGYEADGRGYYGAESEGQYQEGEGYEAEGEEGERFFAQRRQEGQGFEEEEGMMEERQGEDDPAASIYPEHVGLITEDEPIQGLRITETSIPRGAADWLRLTESEISLLEDNPDVAWPLNRSHVGNLITIQKDEINKYFGEGFAGRFKQESQVLWDGTKVSFLIRPETIRVILKLLKAKKEHFLQSKSKPYILLDGPAGVGKSAIMNQVVYWARKNHWIVLFLPDGPGLSGGRGDQIVQCQRDLSMWDQLDLGMGLAKGWMAAHGDQFKKLKLRTEFSIDGFVRNRGTTLYDLLQFGINTEARVCDVIYHLRREVSLITEYPVLLAFDGINSAYHEISKWGDPLYLGRRDKPLDNKQLVLNRAFLHYKEHGLANGITLSSLTHEEPEGPTARSFYATQKHKFSDFIWVPKYRFAEFQKIMDYYQNTKIVQSDVSTLKKSYIYHMNEGRGRLIFKHCETAL